MSGDKLSGLQWEILTLLAPLEPAFTLTGGAALAGIHLRHRTTRDLDLFWRERRELGDLTARVRDLLEGQGFLVINLQTSPTFHRFQVNKGPESCIIDLVAEPFPALAPPIHVFVGERELLVDTTREILASKLSALLGRSEIRDLQDVQALLEAGEDLTQALEDAAHKDGGFSPLTLAWVLRSLPVQPIAQAAGWSAASVEQLATFQTWLLDQLTKLTAPESS